jgi:ABC-type multidrug transport system ATPase subunit
MSEVLAPALRLVRLSKRYAGEQLALAELDLELPRGRLVGLLGPNGSGKSTLLGLCAGALRPSSGSVQTLGFDPRSASPAERGRIGFVQQDVALDPEMTGRETFELLAALNRLSPPRAARELSWLSDALGLGSVLARRVSTYSGGMRRRLHLGLSLLPRSELLLLDEPFVGLDAETHALVWSSLGERARDGATVLISTHELFDAGENCDEVGVLSRGRLLAFAPPQQLIERHAPPGTARPSLEGALRALLREVG